MGTVREVRSGPRLGFIWAMLACGPLALALDLAVSYPGVRHACVTGNHWVLHLVTAGAWAFSVAGVLFARHALRTEFPADAWRAGPRAIDRSYFLTYLGLGLSMGFTIVVLAIAIPKWVIGPCL